MGLPDGWVTGAGLATEDEHRVIGNGVVPQQAVLAIRTILGVTELIEEDAHDLQAVPGPRSRQLP